MVITATRYRRRPRWYARRVMRRFQRLVAQNPGFHRLVLDLPDAQPVETAFLVNPDIEPDVRELLGRVLVLAPPSDDDNPYPLL